MLRQLDAGPQTELYEAQQRLGSSRRRVLVKLLSSAAARDADAVARFERDAATLARLEHVNTVRFFDFGATEASQPFLVTEYLSGQRLADALGEGEGLPRARVEHVVRQIAASLKEAHALGITHGHLGPRSVYLLDRYADRRDVVKVVGYRDAAVGRAPGDLDGPSRWRGYRSPEQISGGHVDARSDVYSLAVLTCRLLTGVLPPDVELPAARSAGVETGPLAARAVPAAMRPALERALSRDPSQRPPSAERLCAELFSAAPAQPHAARPAAPAPVAAPRGTAVMTRPPELDPVAKTLAMAAPSRAARPTTRRTRAPSSAAPPGEAGRPRWSMARVTMACLVLTAATVVTAAAALDRDLAGPFVLALPETARAWLALPSTRLASLPLVELGHSTPDSEALGFASGVPGFDSDALASTAAVTEGPGRFETPSRTEPAAAPPARAETSGSASPRAATPSRASAPAAPQAGTPSAPPPASSVPSVPSSASPTPTPPSPGGASPSPTPSSASPTPAADGAAPDSRLPPLLPPLSWELPELPIDLSALPLPDLSALPLPGLPELRRPAAPPPTVTRAPKPSRAPPPSLPRTNAASLPRVPAPRKIPAHAPGSGPRQPMRFSSLRAAARRASSSQ